MIAFRGSWNRSDAGGQQGYNIVYVPFAGEEAGDDWEIFASGFSQKEHLTSSSEAVYRPTGLAQGPDGSLYISDSEKGRIWRVFYGN